MAFPFPPTRPDRLFNPYQVASTSLKYAEAVARVRQRHQGAAAAASAAAAADPAAPQLQLQLLPRAAAGSSAPFSAAAEWQPDQPVDYVRLLLPGSRGA